MTAVDETIAPGSARSPGPSLQQLLDAERNPVPAALRDHGYVHQGSADVPRARYTSRLFHELEVEHVWRRTWQMACREEDIPEPGDHVVYDVAGESLIVTRADDGMIKALHNSCLHRGTKLRVDDGNVPRFRCPFHGWTWRLDGSLDHLPCDWDFPHAPPDQLCLPEARVATWRGFVFVNLDPDAEPFERYADKLVEHFVHWPLEQRWKSFHAVKVLPCNWKVAMEAFIESYHVIDTHPQILEYTGDANTEYSVWPGVRHVNRMVTPFAVPSPHLDELPEQEVADAALGLFARGARVPVPEGTTARAVAADVIRSGLTAMTGADHSGISDCEALDAIEYYLFPAFAPWAGPTQALIYRWRPYGDDPERCLMDVMRLTPLAEGAPRPAPAPTTRLTLEQSWKEAPGMGGLADIFEQDMSNLPRVQAGLKSTGKRGVTLGNYQEARIRHIHRTIDRYVREGLERAGRPLTDDIAALLVPDR